MAVQLCELKKKKIHTKKEIKDYSDIRGESRQLEWVSAVSLQDGHEEMWQRTFLLASSPCLCSQITSEYCHVHSPEKCQEHFQNSIRLLKIVNTNYFLYSMKIEEKKDNLSSDLVNSLSKIQYCWQQKLAKKMGFMQRGKQDLNNRNTDPAALDTAPCVDISRAG